MNSQAGSKTLLRRKVQLSQYTTMQVGGPAEYFAEPRREDDLLEALAMARSSGLPFVILGKGSNTIFPSEGYPGLVISLLQFEKNKIDFDRETMEVTASAGVFLYRLVLACRDQGFAGCEFLASIPGTVGGAVMMNAGFSHRPGQVNETGPLVQAVRLLHYDGTFETRGRENLHFSYRKSGLEDVIVTEARLRLKPGRPEDIEKEIRAGFDFRNQKQDLTHPSSGSIFRNPPPPFPAAARMIDELGLKGKRIGGAMVSPKHGNYFINAGGATSRDFMELIAYVQEKVFNAYQVRLDPEVRLIAKP